MMRAYSLSLVLVSLLFGPSLAKAETVITAMKDEYSQTKASSIEVIPGSEIQLVADQVEKASVGVHRISISSRNVEDFTWWTTQSSKSGTGNHCEPEKGCEGTRFRPTPYGVVFDVPSYFNWEYIIIHVRNESDPNSDTNHDELILKNSMYVPQYTRPKVVFITPEDYQEQQEEFDYYRALLPHGKWVYIGGIATFVPYAYEISIPGRGVISAAEWQPYTNGRWYWNGNQYVWVSYDPWGEVTDHFGYWRHHNVYGWVWIPSPKREWRPAYVTFFTTETGIGWMPYSEGSQYTHNYTYGYDDGYWEGYNAGLRASAAGYRVGWSYVTYTNFTTTNVVSVREVEYARVETYYRGYHKSYYDDHRTKVSVEFGRAPHPTYMRAHGSSEITVEQTRVVEMRAVGGGTVRVYRPARPSVAAVPPEYGTVHREARGRLSAERMPPVGTVVRASGTYEAPAKPKVHAPIIRDADGRYTPMQDRSREAARRRIEPASRRGDETPRREEPRREPRRGDDESPRREPRKTGEEPSGRVEDRKQPRRVDPPREEPTPRGENRPVRRDRDQDGSDQQRGNPQVSGPATATPRPRDAGSEKPPRQANPDSVTPAPRREDDRKENRNPTTTPPATLTPAPTAGRSTETPKSVAPVRRADPQAPASSRPAESRPSATARPAPVAPAPSSSAAPVPAKRGNGPAAAKKQRER